jgi:class 3 adenylate cyclase
MGDGEYWVTPEFKPVGRPGNLEDAQFLVTGFNTMEPAINFTRDGNLSVHLKVAGTSDLDAALIAQQRLCSILSPSRYRLVKIRTEPAVNNPVGGCLGQAEFRIAAQRLVQRRAGTNSLVGCVAFCDVVDSTQLLSALGDAGWAAVVDSLHSVVGGLLSKHRGSVVKWTGDGFLLFWPGHDSTSAVECMLELDDQTASFDVPVRAGVHWGELLQLRNDVAGIEVNIASRVMGYAGARELLATGSVIDLLDHDVARTTLKGAFPLKGVTPKEWYLHDVAGMD